MKTMAQKIFIPGLESWVKHWFTASSITKALIIIEHIFQLSPLMFILFINLVLDELKKIVFVTSYSIELKLNTEKHCRRSAMDLRNFCSNSVYITQTEKI